MKEDIQLLIELQKSDSDAMRIRMKKKEVPERIARLDESYRSLQQKMDDFRGHLEDLRRLHREKEDRLKSGQDGLKKAKERLESVKNNKEYQAILKEIENLDRKNGDIESEIIGLFDEIDKENGELKLHEGEFKEQTDLYRTDRLVLAVEFKSLY